MILILYIFDFILLTSLYIFLSLVNYLSFHWYRRHDPGFSLFEKLVFLPHIVCDSDRGGLRNDRKGIKDMEEKHNPVNRDIDERDNQRPSHIEEDKSSENSHNNRDIVTCLSNALHAPCNACISKRREVVKRNAYDGCAQDHVKIDKYCRAPRRHCQKEFYKCDPYHSVQGHPQFQTVPPPALFIFISISFEIKFVYGISYLKGYKFDPFF